MLSEASNEGGRGRVGVGGVWAWACMDGGERRVKASCLVVGLLPGLDVIDPGAPAPNEITPLQIMSNSRPCNEKKRARNEGWHASVKSRASEPENESTPDTAAIYKSIRKHMRVHREVPRWFEALAHPLSAVQHVNAANRTLNAPTAFPAADGWQNGEPTWLDVVEYLSCGSCVNVSHRSR